MNSFRFTVLPALTIICIFGACSDPKPQVQMPMGEHCYTNEISSTYILLKFEGKKCYGTGFSEEEDLQEQRVVRIWNSSYLGQFVDDTTLAMTIQYDLGDRRYGETEKWIMGENGKLIVTMNADNARTGQYSECNCDETRQYMSSRRYSDSISNLSDSHAVNEILFESTSPDASRRTQLFDFVRVFLIDSTIIVVGAGQFEGSGMHTYAGKGMKVNDTTYNVNINFSCDEDKDRTSNQNWRFASNKKYLYTNGRQANFIFADEYHRIDKSDVHKDFMYKLDSLTKEKDLN